jgi:hypothetical protein
MPVGAHHFDIWAYGGNVQDDSRFPKGPVPSISCEGLSPVGALPEILIPRQTPDSRFKFFPASRSRSIRASRCSSTRI